MSLHEALKKKLTPEIMGQVEDALGDDFDWDYVPRSRLNTVIKQRNELRAQIADLDAGASKGGNDDDDGDDGKKAGAGSGSGKTLTQADIDAAIAAKEAENQKAINDVKIQYAALDKLREAKAVDPELAFSLIKKESLKFNKEGVLEGLDDQVKALTESKPFLFGSASGGSGGERGTGRDGGGSGGGGGDAVDARLNDVFAGFMPADTTE